MDALGNRLRTEIFNPFDLKVKTGILDTDTYVQEAHYHFDDVGALYSCFTR